MELEEAIQDIGLRHPFFPMALSVVEQKAREDPQEEVKEKNREYSEEEVNKKKVLEQLEKTAAGGFKPELSTPDLKTNGQSKITLIEDKTIVASGRLTADYSVQNWLMAENNYGRLNHSTASGYEDSISQLKLASDLRGNSFNEDHYMSTTAPAEIVSEIMQVAEAQQTMQKIEYAFLLGTTTIASEQFRKMNLWIMQHPAEFLLLEREALTRDVNYRGY